MDIHITTRKFTIHPSVKEHAMQEIKKLNKYFNGILRCNITLSYERAVNSSKIADISLHMYKHEIVSTHKSDDFYKSIDQAILKLEKQLAKYKSKVLKKDKITVRKIKGKV